MSSPVIEHIVEEYAEDAAFLWLLRDAAVDAPHYRLKDLARIDERVEAHLDGLRLAGERGWQIALAALDQHREPGESFAAAALALESRAAGRLGSVLELAGTGTANLRAVVSALGWLKPARVRDIVASLLNDPRPLRRTLGVAACSVHRIDPGSRLSRLLADDDSSVRSRALRLAGELGRVDLLAAVAAATGGVVPGCRFWAAWSGVLLGDRRASLAVLREEVELHGPRESAVLRVVLRAMDAPGARRWLHDLPAHPGKERIVIEAAGILGDVTLVPWLIEQMRQPMTARLASESFSMITGTDLEAESLTASSDSAPEDRTIRRDEDLPWPDPASVQVWWERNRGRMPPNGRLLLGRAVDKAWLQSILAAGLQRHRRAAALELAMANPDAPLFNTQARGSIQAARCREIT